MDEDDRPTMDMHPIKREEVNRVDDQESPATPWRRTFVSRVKAYIETGEELFLVDLGDRLAAYEELQAWLAEKVDKLADQLEKEDEKSEKTVKQAALADDEEG